MGDEPLEWDAGAAAAAVGDDVTDAYGSDSDTAEQADSDCAPSQALDAMSSPAHIEHEIALLRAALHCLERDALHLQAECCSVAQRPIISAMLQDNYEKRTEVTRLLQMWSDRLLALASCS